VVPYNFLVGNTTIVVINCRGEGDKFPAVIFSDTKELKSVGIEIQFRHWVANLKLLILVQVGK
jgi:hypothetical protein